MKDKENPKSRIAGTTGTTVIFDEISAAERREARTTRIRLGIAIILFPLVTFVWWVILSTSFTAYFRPDPAPAQREAPR